jgi:glucose-6-phosphate isomerase
MTEPETVREPAALSITSDGTMTGRSSRYRKRVDDLVGVHLDTSAFDELLAADPGFVVYQVEENRVDEHQGGLVIGTSTIEPGRVGSEYFMTRGHLHAVADRAELYYCLSGRGVMLMETVDGRVRAVELTPGEAVHVPGNWVHRSVNVGTERFSTLFCYAADAGQDYAIIEAAGGMSTLVVHNGVGGWTTIPNPRHRGYGDAAPPERRTTHAGAVTS